MNELLTIEENTRLRHCEAVIERSMNSFYEMGIALREIRESRLYKTTFETFEEYCLSKWSIARNYANKMIASSDVIDNLGTIVPILPNNEGQVRPLTKLEPELQKQAWQEVVIESNQTNEPITAKKVEQVVMKYCNPCVNNAIEFRRVFYLTPYYSQKLDTLMRGEKESTYLRKVIEDHIDSNCA